MLTPLVVEYWIQYSKIGLVAERMARINDVAGGMKPWAQTPGRSVMHELVQGNNTLGAFLLAAVKAKEVGVFLSQHGSNSAKLSHSQPNKVKIIKKS